MLELRPASRGVSMGRFLAVVCAVSMLPLLPSLGPFDGPIGIGRGEDATTTSLTISQGSNTWVVEPLEYGADVVDFYGYTVDSGSSHTPTGLERVGESIAFFYRDADGLSLVFIHSKVDGGRGGAVQMTFTGLPVAEGRWVVMDDTEPVPPDFETDRDTTVSWAWTGCCSDGGAFKGGLEPPFSIQVDSVWDEDAPRFDSRMEPVTAWSFLSGDAENPTVISLNKTLPLGLSSSGTVDPSRLHIPSDLVDPAWRGARPEPFGASGDCPPAGAANTLGFTTDDRLPGGCEGRQLDVPVGPGASVSASVDVGELDAAYGVSDQRFIRFGLDVLTNAALRDGVSNGSVARLALNGDTVGTVNVEMMLQPTVNDGELEFVLAEGLCIRSDYGPDDRCGDALFLANNAPVRLGEGLNELVLTVASGESFERPLSVTLQAVAVELFAPVTFILHGFDPLPWTNQKACSEGPGDDGTFNPFRKKLDKDLRARALEQFGQDPWAYDLDPRAERTAMIPFWSFCAHQLWTFSARELGERIGALSYDSGYEGPVWLVAYSLGGNVAKFYADVLNGRDAGNVERVVTFGSPLHGVCLAALGPVHSLLAIRADILQSTPGRLLLENGAAMQVHPSDRSIGKMAEHEPRSSYSHIAGDRPNGFCEIAPEYRMDGGDGFIPRPSQLANSRYFTEWSAQRAVVNCATHSSKFSGIGHSDPMTSDPEAYHRVAEGLFGGAYPAVATPRSMDECSFEKQVVDPVGKTIQKWGDAVEAKWEDAKGASKWAWHVLEDTSEKLAARKLFDVLATDALPFGLDTAESESPNGTITFSATGQNLSLLVWVSGDRPADLVLTDPSGRDLSVEQLATQGGADVQATGQGALFAVPLGVAGNWSLETLDAPSSSYSRTIHYRVIDDSGLGEVSVGFADAEYRPGDTVSGVISMPGLAPGQDAQVVASLVGLDESVDLPVTRVNTTTWAVQMHPDSSGLYALNVEIGVNVTDGGLVTRAASRAFDVLPRMDWELRDVVLARDSDWWGARTNADVTVCSVGPEPATEPVEVLLTAADLSVGSRLVHLPLEAPDGCVTVPVEWTVPFGAQNLSVEVATISSQASTDNDRIVLPFQALDLRATHAVFEGNTSDGSAFSSNVNVSFYSHQSGALVYPVEYRVNGGAWTVGESFVLEASGVHVVEFRARDPATGFVEPIRSVEVLIDRTPPTSEVLLKGPRIDLDDGVAVSNRTRVLLSATDGPSEGAAGIHLVEYTVLDNASGEEVGVGSGPVSGSVVLPDDEGVYLLLHRAVDRAGNRGPPEQLRLVMDTTGPTIQVLAGAPAVFGDQLIVAPETVVTVAAMDAGVEGASVGVLPNWTFEIREAPGSTVLRTHVVPDASIDMNMSGADGAYGIHWRAVDRLGNIGYGVEALGVDGTPPTAFLLRPGHSGLCGTVGHSVGLVEGDSRCERTNDADGDGFADSVEVEQGSDLSRSMSVPGQWRAVSDGEFLQDSLAAWSISGDLGWRWQPDDAPWAVRPGVTGPVVPRLGSLELFGSGRVEVSQALDIPLGPAVCDFRGVAFDAWVGPRLESGSVTLEATGPLGVRHTFEAGIPVGTLRSGAWNRVSIPASGFDVSFGDMSKQGSLGVGCPSDMTLVFSSNDAVVGLDRSVVRVDNVLVGLARAAPHDPFALPVGLLQAPGSGVPIIAGSVDAAILVEDAAAGGISAGIECVRVAVESSQGRESYATSCGEGDLLQGSGNGEYRGTFHLQSDRHSSCLKVIWVQVEDRLGRTTETTRQAMAVSEGRPECTV